VGAGVIRATPVSHLSNICLEGWPKLDQALLIQRPGHQLL